MMTIKPPDPVPDTPAPAHVLSYWTDGQDYWNADRDLAREIEQVGPRLTPLAQGAIEAVLESALVEQAGAMTLSGQFKDLQVDEPACRPGLVQWFW